jgi:uncharacterized protein YciU (UPF0263 family)
MNKDQTRDVRLDTLVEIIAQTADPDQIILSGLQAQGIAGDVIVVDAEKLAQP